LVTGNSTAEARVAADELALELEQDRLDALLEKLNEAAKILQYMRGD
jgi:hypothetical protein